MKTFYQLILVIAISAIICTACNKGEEEVVVPIYLEDFTEYTSSKSLTAADIKGYLEEDGQTELSALVTHDIKIYIINYKTAFEGDSITASGLIAVPVPDGKKETFPMLSYQHGLIISNSDAPSVNPEGEITELATFIASTGMIVVIPDYIGYGASSEFFHPTLIKSYAINAVLDCIRASDEFIATEKPCNSNGDLFLSGYGEGAYATLASLNSLETSSVTDENVKVTASTFASGIYDLIQFREWLVVQDKYDQPWYLADLLESFTQYAGLDMDYSLVFKEPFNSLISGMIDGNRTADQMNDLFGTISLDELLNSDFREDTIFNSDSTYSSLKQVLTDNSISSWKLNTPVNFYYGKNDTWMPADQSLYIFNSLKNKGSSSTIKINALNDVDHETAVIPSLVKSVIWFKTL